MIALKLYVIKLILIVRLIAILAKPMKKFINNIDLPREKSGFILFLLIMTGMIYLSMLRVDYETQAFISIFLLISLQLIRPLKKIGFWHILFVVISCFIVLRYFAWRITYTLVAGDILSHFCTITLFLAELYGGLMFFCSVFVNIRPIHHKPIPLPSDQSLWPSVDVIIPSFNEAFELVKITLAAARNIDYPTEKLNIYLLDDGGTLEKLNSENKQTRDVAIARSNQLKAHCTQLSIHYLTREQNVKAKAGNLNNALQTIKGELILVLDADHMPAIDILTKLVGSFLQDEKLCLVQTPHFFINPDPFEKNLNLFYRMPAESDMFYKSIQTGLDFWNASFFCGSAAILRRKAIDEIGGFSGKTITEDSETTIKLHSKGWRSHYILHPLISGLQPETFDSFMIQRMRWAQGMVQNFIFNNPLLMPNLSISQRICYLSSMIFWFFPIARVIFLIAPGLYLFFGLKIYHANLNEFYIYTVPFLGALILTDHYIFGKVRWVFVSEIYETMQCLFSFRAVLSVLRHPNKPSFSVTPKMETLHQDLISPLSQPFYWVLVYTLFSVGFGVSRYIDYPEERYIVLFTSFWALYNLLLLLATLGTLHELQQRRANPRFPVHIKAKWVIKAVVGYDKKIPIMIRDISMGGGNVLSQYELPDHLNGTSEFIEVPHEMNNSVDCFKVAITSKVLKKEGYIYGVKFDYANQDEYLSLVKFIHGDSARWVKIYEDTDNNPGLIISIIFMIRTGVSYGVSHIYVVLASFLKKIRNAYV